MRLLLLVPFVVGCANKGNGGASATGSCQPQADNALRFDCDLPTDTDVIVTLEGPEGTLTRAGGPTLTLAGLRPGSTYAWSAAVDGAPIDSGSVTTGQLPDLFDDLSFTVTGTDGPATIALPTMCNGQAVVTVVDATGSVVWYQPFDTTATDPTGGLSGFSITAAQTVLVHLDGSRIEEVAQSGATLFSVDGFESPLHHDLARGDDGRTYALFADLWDIDGQDVILDGVYVLDPDGDVVATWELVDHLGAVDVVDSGDKFWASTFPGAVDVSHANAIDPTPSGSAVMSLMLQDTVISVVLDPDDAAFGEVGWVLGPDGAPIVGDALTWLSGAFAGQHHAHVEADGDLWVFDNVGADGPAGERYAIDTDAGTAEQIASYPVDGACDHQGSVFVDDAGVLVTCPTPGRVDLFDADGAVTWSLGVTCGGGAGSGSLTFARAQPITF
jgi:hypothetical protein